METQSPSFRSLPLDSGLTLAPVTIAYETYGELNEDGSTPSFCFTPSRATPTRPGITAAKEARLVGHDGRPRSGVRHRAVLHDLLQRHRRVQGQFRAGQPRPGHGKGVRAALPGGHGAGYGAGAEDAARPPWHRAAAARWPAAPWGGCRPWSGSRRTRRWWLPASPSPPRIGTRPCRSLSTRWAGRRS